ncbi:MAG TPA: sulfite exporter TauE/SafE family protein [Usitatibacter sp.]|nr:sulfite exporter TauE/SafE family protein [Usitatibacter sp.]
MPALVAAALAAGLLGGVHCVGMCGGIVGTLALEARGPALARQLAYNGGRIAAYAAAGAVAGFVGSLAYAGGAWLDAQVALFLLANVAMLLLGLYVAGWGRIMLRVEAAGRPLWRRIEPFARRMLPVDSTAKALGAGLAWGWIPCGLVYSMLVLAAASGGPAQGALVMGAFGLGTLPNLLAAGLAAQRLVALRRAPWVRRVAGILIIALGVAGIARVPGLREAVLAGWHCIA